MRKCKLQWFFRKTTITVCSLELKEHMVFPRRKMVKNETGTITMVSMQEKWSLNWTTWKGLPRSTHWRVGRAKAQWPWNPRPPPQSYADQSRQLGIFTAVSVLSFFLSLNMQFLSQLKNCFQKGHVKRAKLLSGRLNHLDHQHWEMFPALENEHWKGWDFALP